jgi:hypothetical protein
MKRIFYIAMMAVITTLWCSCEDVETYAEMKEKEKAHIEDFIHAQGIKVIDFDTFVANDSTTNVEANEFVLFKDRGVYMQIVRKGEGRRLEDGERGVYMARYVELNIETGDTLSGNLFANTPDYFTCKCEGDSYTASFTQGYMLGTYGSSAVPNGWLLPLSYVSPGRPNDKAAKVRLILPHGESTSQASQYVYPTYYEITYIPESNI